METKETKHKNGKIREKYDVIINDKGEEIKDGKYESWYENGNKESEGEYMDGKKFGYWKHWNKDKILTEEGEYIDDKKSENWKVHIKESRPLNILQNDILGNSYTKALNEIRYSNNVSINSIKDKIEDNERQIYTSLPKTPKANNNNVVIAVASIIIAVIIIVIVFTSSKENDKKGFNTNVTKTETKQPAENIKETKPTETKKQNTNITTPEEVATKFVNSLGKQDWSAAFGLMTEKRRGKYTNFSSTKGYGGIKSTRIFDCYYTGEYGGKKEVMIDYESIDPSNRSGRFKQYFYMEPFNDSYLISEIKNINIEWY